MTTVIMLGEARSNAGGAPPRQDSACIYDLDEKRNAIRMKVQVAHELAQRARQFGALDGHTVQVCWEEPDAPGVPRYAVGFQYAHTDSELLLAFYTGGPDCIGPTLAIPFVGVRSVLQLTPESVRY